METNKTAIILTGPKDSTESIFLATVLSLLKGLGQDKKQFKVWITVEEVKE